MTGATTSAPSAFAQPPRPPELGETGPIVVVALPLARGYRRPARFRAGVIAIALALATFWPLQYLAANWELGYREYTMFLHGLAFFVSICVLTGGIEGIRRASNSPDDDSWEWLK